jgi:hypothetical protein
MRIYSTFFLLGTCFVLLGCAAEPNTPNTPETKAPIMTDTAETQPPHYTITTGSDGDELAASTQGETTWIDVHSQRGIGSASVEPVSGTPPQNILLRLYLQGLEQFQLSYNGTVVTASVASSDIGDISESVSTPEGGEHSISSDSPLWLEIRVVSSEDQPHIPLEGGYFEIRLPKDFLQDGRRSFSIRWIDFYR